MSEWITIKHAEDVELSEDGKTIDVMYNTNEWGNQYIEIPIEFIKALIPSVFTKAPSVF